MSKDLSKEYKEAVMNDLPDLWDRIEAAIDAEETAGKTQEDTVSNVIGFTKAENNTNSSIIKTNQTETGNSDSKGTNANKYAVNAFDNEPIIKQSKKKKMRIPAWVFVAIPSAAVLVLVILPIAFLMSRSGLSGTKNYDMATAVAYDSEPNSVVTDAAPASVDSGESYYFEDAAVEENSGSYEYTDTDDFDTKDYYKQNFTGSSGSESESFPTLDIPQLVAPEKTDRENTETGTIVNDRVTVDILSVNDSPDGNYKIVEALIVEFKGETSDTDAENLKEGDTIYAYAESDSDFTVNETYDVSIVNLPHDELLYEIVIFEEE